jgi:hypothetical protein
MSTTSSRSAPVTDGTLHFLLISIPISPLTCHQSTFRCTCLCDWAINRTLSLSRAILHGVPRTTSPLGSASKVIFDVPSMSVKTTIARSCLQHVSDGHFSHKLYRHPTDVKRHHGKSILTSDAIPRLTLNANKKGH